MMTFFLALFSWRMISERQRTIRSLRPFVTSERMYDQMVGLEGEVDQEGGGLTPFAALCRDVLDTRRGLSDGFGADVSSGGIADEVFPTEKSPRWQMNRQKN